MNHDAITTPRRLRRFRTVAAAVAAAAALAILVLPAPPADAHQVRVDRQATAEGLKVIALKARVQHLDSRDVRHYEMVPAEHVQLVEGDRVRVDVVGTAIVNGNGVERDVPVRLELAAGSRYVDVTTNRDGSAIVATQAIPAGDYGDDGLVRAQLAFTVVGNYDMRDNLRSGRITFEIRPRTGRVDAPVTGNARWQRALEIANHVAEVNANPGQGTPNWVVERIYRDGYQGARDAALELAVQAERAGHDDRHSPNEMIAHLYRHLLGRSGSDREIQLADETGFNRNLRIYQQRGYRELVEIFVESDEFRRHHDFAALERMEFEQGHRGRGHGVIDREDLPRRPRPRG